MATMSVYSMDAEEMQKHATLIFESVLAGLADWGELSHEAATNISGSYCVVIGKKGVLGRAWDRLFAADAPKNLFIVRLVQVK